MIAQRAARVAQGGDFSFGVTSGGSLVLLFLIAVAAAMASRDFRARQRESWLRAGQMGLSELMQGDQPLERLGDNVLRFLAQYLDAQVGAVFIAEGGRLRRVAGYALPPGPTSTSCAPATGSRPGGKDNARCACATYPPDYLPIGSGIGPRRAGASC